MAQGDTKGVITAIDVQKMLAYNTVTSSVIMQPSHQPNPFPPFLIFMVLSVVLVGMISAMYVWRSNQQEQQRVNELYLQQQAAQAWMQKQGTKKPSSTNNTTPAEKTIGSP